LTNEGVYDSGDNMQTRKNIRLKEYDYSQTGYYFVTLCTKDKKCTLWDNITHNNTSQTANGVGAANDRPYDITNYSAV
jgi:hypothetical protein